MFRVEIEEHFISCSCTLGMSCYFDNELTPSTWKNKDPKFGGNIVASSSLQLHNKIIKLLKPVA